MLSYSSSCWLKQFDYVARRVLAENLFSSGPFHNVIFEFDTALCEFRNYGFQIVESQNEPGPTAWAWYGTIRHRFRCGSVVARKPQRQFVKLYDCHVRAEILFKFEAKVRNIELNGFFPSANVTFDLEDAVDDNNSTADRLDTVPTGMLGSFDSNAKNIPGTDLASGSAIGVWVKLTLAAGASAAKSTYTLETTGSTA